MNLDFRETLSPHTHNFLRDEQQFSQLKPVRVEAIQAKLKVFEQNSVYVLTTHSKV